MSDSLQRESEVPERTGSGNRVTCPSKIIKRSHALGAPVPSFGFKIQSFEICETNPTGLDCRFQDLRFRLLRPSRESSPKLPNEPN